MHNQTTTRQLATNGTIAATSTALGVCSIRAATAQDDPWLRHLSRIYSNQIGFLPDCARRDRVERGHVKLIEINGMSAGFFIHSLGLRKTARLSQIAISEDAWRNGIGKFAVETLLDLSRHFRYTGMIGSIREGLPMNLVAEQTGGVRTARVLTSTARGLPTLNYEWEKRGPGRSPRPSAGRR